MIGMTQHKTLVLTKLAYKFNAILIKIPISCFKEPHKSLDNSEPRKTKPVSMKSNVGLLDNVVWDKDGQRGQ